MIIKPEEQKEALIYSFRYALGRKTYAPLAVSDWIIRAWPDLAECHRSLFKREIKEAIELDRAGMDCDVANWKRIIEIE